MKFVYALVDPRADEIFYVGQSRRGPYEPEWYIKSAHRGSTQRKVKAKLRQLHSLGLKAEWCILEETDDLDVAETFWICSLLAAGARLTNMKFGGYEAKSTRHPDTGKNISKARKGQPNLPARKPEARPEINCSGCGRMFRTYVRPRDRIAGREKFLCHLCCEKRHEKVTRQCRVCGSEISLLKGDPRLKRGQRNFFCSTAHSVEFSRGVSR